MSLSLKSYRPTIGETVVLIIAAIISLLILAFILTAPFNHNEEMYMTASIMITRGYRLYNDFAYVQTPYLPFIYASILQITGIENALLVGRISSTLVLIVTGLAIAFKAYRIERSIVIAGVIWLSFVLNPIVLAACSESSNYAAAMLFSVLAALLLVQIHTPVSRWKLVTSGLLLGLAVNTRLTYLAIVPGYLLILFVYPRISLSLQRAHKIALFCGGFVLASIPSLYYLITIPDVFLFNILRFHLLMKEYIIENPGHNIISGASKFIFVMFNFLRPEIFATTLAVMSIIVALPFYVNRERSGAPVRWGMLGIVLLVLGIFGAAYPTPVHIQYQLLIVQSFYLLLVMSLVYLSPKHKNFIAICLGIASLISCLYFSFSLQERMPNYRFSTTPNAVSTVATEVRAHLGEEESLVATLSPLHILSPSVNTYEEFSTGVFAYRIADRLSPGERDSFVMTSSKQLRDLLNARPPDAIFIRGIYDNYTDQPFVQYAEEHNFIPIETDNYSLYVRDR